MIFVLEEQQIPNNCKQLKYRYAPATSSWFVKKRSLKVASIDARVASHC